MAALGQFYRGVNTYDDLIEAMQVAKRIDMLATVLYGETGCLPLDRRETDLAALVVEVAAAARAQTDRHSVSVEAPPSAPAWVDPLRLEQVLTNLVNNAIKYSPDGGTIAIAVTQHADTAQVTVRDHGLGIPPEHREHIFDRFYQAHSRSHRSGMGLGLYISRQIVDLHGGSIIADFPADGGTRFVVTLPTRKDETP